MLAIPALVCACRTARRTILASACKQPCLIDWSARRTARLWSSLTYCGQAIFRLGPLSLSAFALPRRQLLRWDLDDVGFFVDVRIALGYQVLPVTHQCTWASTTTPSHVRQVRSSRNSSGCCRPNTATMARSTRPTRSRCCAIGRQCVHTMGIWEKAAKRAAVHA